MAADAALANKFPETVDRLIEEVAELRRSRKRLVTAANADRQLIERALHDGVQQRLVALAVSLQRVALLVDTDPVPAKALLDDLTVIVRQALDETAQLAQRVYPPLLEVRGLASALRSVAQSAGLTIRVEILSAADYPPEITIAVYWCCAEALSSAPFGTHATITVLDTDGSAAFEVSVAGDFPDRLLERLRDRLEAFGGSLAVRADPDGGSRLSGSLPIFGPA